MAINRVHKVFMKHREVHWGACVYLLDGPLTLEQIKTQYQKIPFPLSQQAVFYAEGNWNMRGLERLPNDLAGLLKAGWVIQKGDRFSLTERGREQVNQILEKARTSSEWVNRNLHSDRKSVV
jgi:hypothetical protein